MDKTQECGSTRFFLEEILPLFPDGLSLEVETYTWTILPPELQSGTVTDCLIREIEWVTKTMGKTSMKDTAVKAMFETIAPGYDFQNSFLSLRRDIYWRRALAEMSSA